MKALVSLRQWIRRHFFIQLLVFFTLFFIITQVFSMGTYWDLKRGYESSLIATHTQLSANISTSVNRMLDEIFQANYFISLDEDVKTVYSSLNTIEDAQDYYILPGVMRTLSTVTAYSDYIDGIAIYKRDSNLIISDKSVYNDEEYFSLYHRYDLYDYSFWSTLDPDMSSYKILSPTTGSTYQGGTNRMLLPIIQSGAFGSYSPNLFIIDLKYDSIQTMLDSYTLTENSMLYILDRDTQQILFSSTPKNDLDLSSQYDALFSGSNHSYKARWNAQEYLLISQDVKMGFQPIKIVTCIPQADVTRVIKENGSSTLLISMSWNVIVALLLIFLLSSRAYRPLRKLMESLVPGTPATMPNAAVAKSKSEFDVIKDIFDSARLSLTYTQLQLGEAQELAQEQILRKALLGKRLSTKELQQIEAVCPHFSTACFQAVLLNPIYKKAIYKDFTNDFLGTVLSIIKGVLPTIFSTPLMMVTEVDKNQLCLVFWDENAYNEQLLHQQCQKLLDIFGEDKRYLSLFMYIGSQQRGLDGLSASFASAQDIMSKASPYSECYIVGGKLPADAQDISLGPEIENKLVNLIASGKQEPAVQEVAEAMERFLAGRPSVTSIKYVVMQCYFIAVKALQQNDLEISLELNRRFTEFNANLSAYSSERIVEFMTDFFKSIMNGYGEIDYALNTKLFKDYIDSNYQKDLTLDHLAQKYHTSPQYISRLLKKELDMPFQTYISRLRIAKAQELLIQTDMQVTDIYERVGYNSRNTFIRTFKIICGITPTEYRKMHNDRPL